MPGRRESFRRWLLALVIAGPALVVIVLAIGPLLRESSLSPFPAESDRTTVRERAGAPASTQPSGDTSPRDDEATAPKASARDPVALGAEPAAKGSDARLRLLVPAYFYPSGPNLDLWDRLIRGASRAPILIVANPASGPGENPDPNYTAIIRRGEQHGATIIGYVDTRYGKRPTAEARADVDRWHRFYPAIRGIFLDAQASEPEQVEYYAALRKYVLEKIERAIVVGNPGTVTAEEYYSRPTADLACVFEGPQGFDQFRLPAWSDRYPSAGFAALAYGIERPEKMRECVRLAVQGKIGTLYVSDGIAPNPWGQLPRYWEAEVEAVHRVNRRQEP